ncbi:MAG: hypothetical protein QM500_14995 [Methylococcales bacterium]
MAISFTQVCDTRFNEDVELLQSRIDSIMANLSSLKGVVATHQAIKKLTFADAEPCTQWRVDFVVQNKGRLSTWDDVYSAINKVKAVFYKRM